MRRFKIGDSETVYVMRSLDEVTLSENILFNAQAADLGIAERWHDVESAAYELALIDLVAKVNGADAEDVAERHPLGPLVFGTQLWLARRSAGENVTLEQAVDVRITDLTFLPEPEDKKSGKAKARKGTRKVSAPAAEPPAPSR